MRIRTLEATLALLALLGPIGIRAQQADGAAQPEAAPAQPAGEGQAAPAPEDVDALIARMREKIEHMDRIARERDQALKFLREQVEQATKLIGETSETAQSLRSERAVLGTRLEELSRIRDELAGEVSEREKLLRALEARVAALTDLLGLEKPDRHRLGESLDALKTKLGQALSERDELRRQVASLEGELAAREQALGEAKATAAAERERLEKELADLRTERERVARELEESRGALSAREEEIARLAAEVERLNGRLSTLTALLADNEERLDHLSRVDREQKATIERLTAQLNEALARKVEELQQYRSEFLGRLRQVLGDHPDIRIEGDRFVLQSEILFPSGSAELEPEGKRRLEEIANTLKEIAAKIPPDVDWVLRVDGHTDKRPLRPDSPYRDNWELSTARALTVVKFLIDRGIPPERLVAAGFGEYRPVDPGDSEQAYRRNRRIEFRLTQR
ncbi:Outer membrane protein A [bacterium HR39]|nr:Outer membrane protein A [bacterium HR39]